MGTHREQVRIEIRAGQIFLEAQNFSLGAYNQSGRMISLYIPVYNVGYKVFGRQLRLSQFVKTNIELPTQINKYRARGTNQRVNYRIN